MPDTDVQTTPMIFDHCVSVYEEMEKNKDSTAEPDKIYEGHLTKLFQELGLSTPYYTSVMKALKRMGCVEQIRRGGGNAPSRWLLAKVPTEELFHNTIELKKPLGGRTAILEQRVSDMNSRLQRLEQAIGMHE